MFSVLDPHPTLQSQLSRLSGHIRHFCTKPLLCPVVDLYFLSYLLIPKVFRALLPPALSHSLNEEQLLPEAFHFTIIRLYCALTFISCQVPLLLYHSFRSSSPKGAPHPALTAFTTPTPHPHPRRRMLGCWVFISSLSEPAPSYP